MKVTDIIIEALASLITDIINGVIMRALASVIVEIIGKRPSELMAEILSEAMTGVITWPTTCITG